MRSERLDSGASETVPLGLGFPLGETAARTVRSSAAGAGLKEPEDEAHRVAAGLASPAPAPL